MSSFEYAEMIEMPSSCEMVVVPDKKKRSSKRKLMGKVNGKKLFARKSRKSEEAECVASVIAEDEFFLTSGSNEIGTTSSMAKGGTEDSAQAIDNSELSTSSQGAKDKPIIKKRKFSFNIISAQVAAVFVLAVAILVTNIFWKDSGINNLFKEVFAPDATTADDRDYTAFAAFSPSKSQIEVENGIMTVTNGGAIYSPCDGVVESAVLNEGKYTLTINHSNVYKTVIIGADYSYAKEGDKVYTAAPVCYSLDGGVQVAMYNENALISDYTVDGGLLVWQS